MRGNLERIYVRLLRSGFQNRIFGALKGFQKKGEAYLAYCPFHEDVFPTLVIYNQKPEYFCFACGASGDWLSFLQNHVELSFQDALLLLAQAADIDSSDVTEASWKKDLQWSHMLELAEGFFTTWLYSPAGEGCLKYLYNRGYSMTEVEGSGFGCYPGWNKTREYLLSQGLSPELVGKEIAGFLSMESVANALTIPYRDSCGRIMAMMARDTAMSGPEAYMPLAGMSYVSDVPYLLSRCVGKDEILMVEGFFDAMLIDRIGIMSAVSIGKNGLSASQLDTIMESGIKKCILCLGNLPAKKQLTLDAMTMIRARGLDSAFLELKEPYEDIDQYVRKTDLHHLEHLLKKQRRLEDLLNG